jgi:hypothetical protein
MLVSMQGRYLLGSALFCGLDIAMSIALLYRLVGKKQGSVY